MAEQRADGFEFSQKIWGSEHRVLFSRPELKSEKLDPSVHYIFGGSYTAVVKRDNGEELWTLVTAAFDTASFEERSLLLSNESTETNVKKLRKFL